MPLNAEALLSREMPPVEQTLSDRDCMLYALSIGLGRDPMNRDDLRYVYEKDLQVFPTMPVVIGHPGRWAADPALGITYTMLVHGAQRVELHEPIPVGRPLVSTNRVVQVLDKGADKGGLIVTERRLFDSGSGDLLATSESTVFCRADGGFGGPSEPAREYRAVPDARPGQTVSFETAPNAALWYRLNVDRNPLHVDPDIAAKAGFERPILHGLCSFGMLAVEILRACGDLRAGHLASFEARFSKPVVPGDRIGVELWRGDGGVAFRARAGERDAVAFDRGFATFR